jgi:hypothetical protein
MHWNVGEDEIYCARDGRTNSDLNLGVGTIYD